MKWSKVTYLTITCEHITYTITGECW